MSQTRQFSVAAKFNSLVVIFSLLITTAVVAYLTYHQYAYAKERLLLEAIASTSPPGHALELAIYYEDPEMLGHVISSLLKNPALDYAAIYDYKSNLLSQKNKHSLERIPSIKETRQHTDGLEQSNYEYVGNISGDKYYDLVIPIFSPINPGYSTLEKEDFFKNLADYGHGRSQYVMGYARLGLNQAGIMKQTIDYFLLLAVVAICIVLLNTLISMVITRRITAPLKELVKISKRISEGDFDIRMPSNNSFEIKEVASSMNYMIKSVEAYQTKLKTSHELLALKVKERTAQLSNSNKQLQKAISEAVAAKDIAEHASRAKSEFLATMSHEIRTPLNGVLGMTEMLTKTALSKEQQKFTGVIQESGRALLDVINDILDFSKIEAGKLELSVTRFNLRRLIEDIINMFSSLAHNKGLSLNYSIPKELNLTVESDAVRLRQILSNLISNAIKFTHQGEITLSLKLTGSDAGRSRIRFEVADTGIGINKSKLEHIFLAFTQEDGSTTRKFGGTGLGLAISQQLIALMGGEIRVESQAGKGSRFWFEVDMQTEIDQNRPPKSQADLLQQLRFLVLEPADQRVREVIEEWKIDCGSVDSVSLLIERIEANQSRPNQYNLLILQTDILIEEQAELLAFLKRDQPANALQMILINSPLHPVDTGPFAEVAEKLILLNQPLHQSDLYDAIINLAMSKEAYAAAPAEASSQDQGAKPAGAKFSARVLLAEDTVVNQEVALTMLEWLGCEATLANNGQEAADLFVSGEYDLVFMDCQMPVMDGYAATAAIRNKEGFSNITKNPQHAIHIPIVALTASAVESEREKCLAAGMDDFLAKPFRHQDIEAMLQKWLPAAMINQQETKAFESDALLQEAPPGAKVDKVAASESGNKKITVINRKSLDNLRAIQMPGGADIVRKVINAYLTESSNLLAKLQQANHDNDPEALYKVAHALKSSSANVGALTLAGLCKSLEAIGRQGSMEGTKALLASVEHEYQSAVTQLQFELNNDYGKQASA